MRCSKPQVIRTHQPCQGQHALDKPLRLTQTYPSGQVIFDDQRYLGGWGACRAYQPSRW